MSIESRHAHGIIFSTVRVFYCDHFVLTLPADHSFPMATYRLTRERIVAAIARIHAATIAEAARASRAHPVTEPA